MARKKFYFGILLLFAFSPSVALAEEVPAPKEKQGKYFAVPERKRVRVKNVKPAEFYPLKRTSFQPRHGKFRSSAPVAAKPQAMPEGKDKLLLYIYDEVR